jgi:hypothetical protein
VPSSTRSATATPAGPRTTTSCSASSRTGTTWASCRVVSSVGASAPESLTRTSPRYAIERFAACKAAFLATGFLGASDEYVLWGYGHTGRGLRRALLSHGKRPTHVVEVHPGRIGNRIHGAPVITPDALAALADRPVVVSVAREGPRAEVRAWMARHGRRETIDYVCAA